MRKHKDLPITFASWYQCNRLDEISSGIEDLVGYNEIIAQGEEFNICKAKGYDILPGNPTEVEAYRAGKRELKRERELLQKKLWEEEARWAEREAKFNKGCSQGLFFLFIGLPLMLAAIAGLAWLLRTIFFGVCDAVEWTYNLICANVFLICLLLIPSVIIFVGYKIESKKNQNKDIK